MEVNKVYNEDCLIGMKRLPDNCIDCCVTSPPYYGLRDYGCDGQIGLEKNPLEYIDRLTEVFAEVYRVLKPEGTLWLNLGDSYAGSGKGASNYPDNAKLYKQGSNRGSVGNRTGYKYVTACKDKDLIGIPWMAAFALRDRVGYYLRNDIIWCLSGGAYLYVKSQKGVMPMMVKDMVRLDPSTVQLWNGKKWVNVIGYGESNDTSERIELVLRSGERIGCTGGHKWVLSDGREVLARDLKTGDILKTCTLPDNEQHKPQFFSKDLLWFIGLYLAEGSLSNRCIQLALNTDELAWVERITDVAYYYGGSCTYSIEGNKLSVRVYSRIILAILEQYLGGHTAKDKHLNNICWSMPNEWLKELVTGYFDGDGHYDVENNRIRLGFTRNYNLERDLRILASRLGAELTLNPAFSKMGKKLFPTFKGEWRWQKSGHNNCKEKSEIVEIRNSRARHFYDISVDSDDHLFALASGVLTHNCKPNAMPESVTDRLTKSHEYIFLMSKSSRYYFDHEAIQEVATGYDGRKDTVFHGSDKYIIPVMPHGKVQGMAKGGHQRWRFKNLQEDGQKPNTMHLRRADGLPDKQYPVRNKRDVWLVNTKPDPNAHFAVYPEELIIPCVLAGCPKGGIILDPFMGSGTTARVARTYNRNFIGYELNPDYIKIINQKIVVTPDMFA